MKRSALLVCADENRSIGIINALESEHDIWHVQRQRDALAWLNHNLPHTLILDFEMGLDAEMILDFIRSHENEQTIVIGLSVNPSLLSESVISKLDQLA
jgi:hypothetical protein